MNPAPAAALDDFFNNVIGDVTETSIGVDPTQYLTNVLAVTATLSINVSVGYIASRTTVAINVMAGVEGCDLRPGLGVTK